MNDIPKPDRVDMEAVAQRAGVSISTVSRVINKSAFVTPETAARVRQAIAELNYIPNKAASILASKKTRTIGLLLATVSPPMLGSILKGIEDITRKDEYSLLVSTVRDPKSSPVPTLGEHNTDGLIIWTDKHVSEQAFRHFYEKNFPVVLMHGTPPDGVKIPTINIENRKSSFELISHLIEKCGRRRIALLRGRPNYYDAHWREVGYREALEAHGIPVDESLIGIGNFDSTDAENTITQWLEDGVDFDAVYTSNDLAALGTYKALKEAGKHIPADVAVVGFDDVFFARNLDPPLTTITVDFEQFGRKATEVLFGLIEGKNVPYDTILPTKVTVRNSCGKVK